MSIDVLNKAARAAGFAMAAPDEDTLVEPRWSTPEPEKAGRAIVPVAQVRQSKTSTVDTVMTIVKGVRNMMPSFGGRAPA